MKLIVETLEKTFGTYIIPKRIIYDGNSKYQHIVLFENEKYGKVLKLGHALQTSEYDEYMYHEPLTQPAMCSHPKPEKVLIIGGGDGGALEEVLKHNTVKRAVVVELDEKVVELAKKHLQSINRGAFNDKRTEVIIGDGIEYVKNSDEKFDVIVLDLTDPNSISTYLYTDDFYRVVKSRLNKRGILALHVETPFAVNSIHLQIAKTLTSVFNYVRFFYSFVPIFGSLIGFAVCSDNVDAKKVSAKEIEKRIRARGVKDLAVYGPEMHVGFMAMSGIVERRIKDPKIKVIKKGVIIRDYDELDKIDGVEMLKKLLRC